MHVNLRFVVRTTLVYMALSLVRDIHMYIFTYIPYQLAWVNKFIDKLYGSTASSIHHAYKFIFIVLICIGNYNAQHLSCNKNLKTN